MLSLVYTCLVHRECGVFNTAPSQCGGVPGPARPRVIAAAAAATGGLDSAPEEMSETVVRPWAARGLRTDFTVRACTAAQATPAVAAWLSAGGPAIRRPRCV